MKTTPPVVFPHEEGVDAGQPGLHYRPLVPRHQVTWLLGRRRGEPALQGAHFTPANIKQGTLKGLKFREGKNLSKELAKPCKNYKIGQNRKNLPLYI